MSKTEVQYWNEAVARDKHFGDHCNMTGNGKRALLPCSAFLSVSVRHVWKTR
jgi:hypothetical protein